MSCSRLLDASLAVAATAVAVTVRRRLARHRADHIAGAGPGVRTADGVLLHVEADGPEDAPATLVFAHGFSAALQEYACHRQQLREDYRLVFFDQRGHGQSGWGSYRRATLDQLGDDLGRVLDEFTGTGPVVLVGHSLGGMAVAALARARPELFGGQVWGAALLSTSVEPPTLGLPQSVVSLLHATRSLRLAARVAWFWSPFVHLLHPFRTRLGRRALRSRLFGAGPTPQDVERRMENMWLGTSRSVAAAFYPTMLDLDLSDALGIVGRVPTLVLTGAADETISARHSARMADRLGANVRLVRVPGAGHMVIMTHASVVCEHLRDLARESVRRHSAATENV